MWLYDVVCRPGVSDGEHGQMRFQLMEQFAMFETICDRNGRWLPQEDIDGVTDCIENALLCFNALAAEASDAERFMWQVLPKAHMTTHLAYDFAASGVNPRRCTCYADEDMIGRVKKLWNLAMG